MSADSAERGEVIRSAESHPLAQLSQARELLEASRNLSEVKSIRDVALAAQEYARAKKLGEESERYASEIAVRAERRIGQLLTEVAKAAGGDHRSEDFKSASPAPLKSPRQSVDPGGSPDTNKRLSARSQKLAKIDEDEFERRIADRSTKLSADRLARIQRDREAEERRIAEARAQAAAEPVPTRVDIRQGDFRQVLAGLQDIDAIITDPPYPAEYLPLLADLGAWADKVLAPDGVLAVLMGQTHLPEVYRLLDGHRPYRWTACYLTEGPGYVSHPRRVQSSWKPLLIYGGGPRFSDVFRSDGDSGKEHHKWGQNFAAFSEIIERFTTRGQTVCDPFMGSGTTLLAANALGRHAVGCDIDAEAVAVAEERLA